MTMKGKPAFTPKSPVKADAQVNSRPQNQSSSGDRVRFEEEPTRAVEPLGSSSGCGASSVLSFDHARSRQLKWHDQPSGRGFRLLFGRPLTEPWALFPVFGLTCRQPRRQMKLHLARIATPRLGTVREPKCQVQA